MAGPTSNLMRALIVDDEEAARSRLKRLLSRYPDSVEILGEATHAAEALDLIERLHPDVIFLDIRMPGPSGIELVRQLVSPPNVVFVTAYASYAVEAFERNAVDYLLKPVEEQRLAATIGRLQDRSHRPAGLENRLTVFESLLNREKTATTIPVQVNDRFLFIPLNQVTHFEARDKYVYLYTADGKSYLTEHTLQGLCRKLPAQFLQVHRSYVINRDHLSEAAPLLGGRFALRLNGKTPVSITTGRSYLAEVKALLRM